MPANDYGFVKITNVSGSTQELPFVPPQGVSLDDGESVTRYWGQFSKVDKKGLDAAQKDGLIRYVAVPALDSSGFWQNELVAEVEFPEAGVSLSTGVLASVFDSDRRPPRRMRIVGAEFHVNGIGDIGAGPNGASTTGRSIALRKDGAWATSFKDINPTAPAAGADIVPSNYRTAPVKGDVIQLDNIDPSADIVTEGSSMDVYVTAVLTGTGATGAVRVRLVPTPTGG